MISGHAWHNHDNATRTFEIYIVFLAIKSNFEVVLKNIQVVPKNAPFRILNPKTFATFATLLFSMSPNLDTRLSILSVTTILN